MKNLLLSFAVLVSILAVSCKKDTKTQPQNPTAPKSINVEYRVSCESGMVNVSYLIPNSNGKLEREEESITRTSYSFNFNYTSGNLFSVEASNSTPSHKVVQVQIYIDGVLFKEGSTTNPAEKAIAEGNY